MTQDLRAAFSFLDSPEIALAAGLAAGLAYWLVAGRTAGFWKPVRSTRPTAAAARP